MKTQITSKRAPQQQFYVPPNRRGGQAIAASDCGADAAEATAELVKTLTTTTISASSNQPPGEVDVDSVSQHCKSTFPTDRTHPDGDVGEKAPDSTGKVKEPACPAAVTQMHSLNAVVSVMNSTGDKGRIRDKVKPSSPKGWQQRVLENQPSPEADHGPRWRNYTTPVEDRKGVGNEYSANNRAKEGPKLESRSDYPRKSEIKEAVKDGVEYERRKKRDKVPDQEMVEIENTETAATASTSAENSIAGVSRGGAREEPMGVLWPEFSIEVGKELASVKNGGDDGPSDSRGAAGTEISKTGRTSWAPYEPPGRRSSPIAHNTTAGSGAAVEVRSLVEKQGSDGGEDGEGRSDNTPCVPRPKRVSQKDRVTDNPNPSPPKPAPERKGAVACGGMSVYGANISEYSESMSREQVEACTVYVTGFPAALPRSQRTTLLQPFVDLGALITWADPGQALATFSSHALARQALETRHKRSSSSVLQAILLSEAGREQRRRLQHVCLVNPGRPPSDVSSATRLISGALGRRLPQTKHHEQPQGRRRDRGSRLSSGPTLDGDKGSTDSWDL
ncbi:unnamed protein product [Discosporangium mesarthrocarpum]